MTGWFFYFVDPLASAPSKCIGGQSWVDGKIPKWQCSHISSSAATASSASACATTWHTYLYVKEI